MEGNSDLCRNFPIEPKNQLTSPSALQLYYDYSSFGIAQLDLGAQNDRFPRGYAQAIGSGFVPASLAYRRQHVLAIFHTFVPMANLSEDIERSMAASDGKLQQAMFGSSDGKGMANLLGATPIAGFIYTVTTRASIFPLTYDQRCHADCGVHLHGDYSGQHLSADGMAQRRQRRRRQKWNRTANHLGR
uniref:Autotransporter domain-containing protein n=1 Tax=Globodera pallida TaxID=36090 RepID=A0A183BM73_GLOPA